jgi:hypothetical protein
MVETLDPDSCFFELCQHRSVIFYHKGYFSHGIVAAMSEVVKRQLEAAGLSASTRRKIFSSFIELSQNIVHYSAGLLEDGTEQGGAIREGAVCIFKEGEHHCTVCVNPITTMAVNPLRKYLEPLCGMSVDEIKEAYKQSLRAETPANSKGSGLGFLTMARDASAPLEFAFHPRDDDPDTTMFCLKTII